jgi:hypothetical protein
MPTPTNYTYSLTTDFPDDAINSAKFASEIGTSTIITALDRIDVNGDDVDVWFKDALSAGDETVLDGLPAVHDNTSSVLQPVLTGDGVTLSVPQPQKIGYEMCDRDLKFITCKITQATAVEDLKVNPTTLKEESWAGPELALIGVFKDGTPNMAACTDQTDADTNGVLSVFEYKAYDQADGTTQIPYNIRSGAIVHDPAIPAGERFAHRAYVVAVPGLGQSYMVRLFDGYLTAHPENMLDVESPQAKMLDPTPYPGVANVIRIYVYHPQGQSNAHVLWLLTYRPAGTF